MFYLTMCSTHFIYGYMINIYFLVPVVHGKGPFSKKGNSLPLLHGLLFLIGR